MKGPITLFTDYGCPFTQRLEALLRLQEMAYGVRLEDAAAKSKELLAMTPSGRVPFVTIGALQLHETVVIADYLADELGWEAAYPDDAELRVQHQIGIRRLEAMWDSSVSSRPHKPSSATHTRRIEEDLDGLERAVALTSEGPNMLLLAAVPLWLRWCWIEDVSDMAARIRERPGLLRWLDEGAQLDCLQATTPDADRVRRVHALG